MFLKIIKILFVTVQENKPIASTNKKAEQEKQKVDTQYLIFCFSFSTRGNLTYLKW